MLIKYRVGDIVRTRKPHPCGGDTWEIMRTGVDFRLKCTTCGRVIMLPRPKFEKSVRSIVKASQEAEPGPGEG